MRIIGKASDSQFIVEMSYREVYELCGNKTPQVGQTADIEKITGVVKSVMQSQQLIQWYAAGLRGHVDAINGAAQKIVDAVNPAVQASLRSEEGG